MRISNLQSFINLFVEVYAEINKELQEIYQEFKDKGFDILDFPGNQFGEQAKGSDEEIPLKVAGCVGLEVEEAQELYKLLYKILGKR